MEQIQTLESGLFHLQNNLYFIIMFKCQWFFYLFNIFSCYHIYLFHFLIIFNKKRRARIFIKLSTFNQFCWWLHKLAYLKLVCIKRSLHLLNQFCLFCISTNFCNSLKLLGKISFYSSLHLLTNRQNFLVFHLLVRDPYT